MRFRLFLVIVLLAGSINSFAEPAKKKTIEELFELTNAKKMTDNIYAQMDGLYKQILAGTNISEKEKPILDNFQKKIMVMVQDEVSWEKLKEPMINAYSSIYTEEDVQGIITFYKTPAGQSMLKKMPELIQATMLVTQESMKNIMPKIQAMQKDLEKEISASKKKR